MFLSLFGFFDLFRQPMMLYFNGTSKRASSLGILTSISIYVFLVYSFFTSNLYKKESPIVITQNTQSPFAPAMQFDESKTFTFAISDSFGNRYMDPTIFTVMFRYFYTTFNFEVRELRPCVLSDVKNETIFDNYQFNKSYCLKNQSFFLQGDAGSDSWQYVAVSLFLCDNSTSNNTCKKSQKSIIFSIVLPPRNFSQYFSGIHNST